MKVKVGVSNRHIHLSEEVKNILFGKDYEINKRNDLSQIGEYATYETIDVKTDKNILKNVRVLGPLRDYTQLEVSKTDSYFLGINPPVRNSGDLKESENATLIGPNGSYYLKSGVIIANRHIHMTEEDAKEKGFVDNEEVKIRVLGEKSGILEKVYVKIKNTFRFELHLDTDDANAFLLNTGDDVEIIRKD